MYKLINPCYQISLVSSGIDPGSEEEIMGKVITGAMFAEWGRKNLDYKGTVLIEWSGGWSEDGKPQNIFPGCLTTVYDEEGRVLPVANAEVHVPPEGLITADLAVYLDENGEILYDLNEIAKSEAVPATFPFLVIGMRTR
jgi:hypothetical protein